MKWIIAVIAAMLVLPAPLALAGDGGSGAAPAATVNNYYYGAPRLVGPEASLNILGILDLRLNTWSWAPPWGCRSGYPYSGYGRYYNFSYPGGGYYYRYRSYGYYGGQGGAGYVEERWTPHGGHYHVRHYYHY